MSKNSQYGFAMSRRYLTFNMKVILLIIINIFFVTQSIGQNYLPGDTLSVVAINGLKLREDPNIHSPLIAILNNGEKVVILKSDQQKEDIIEGFQGHWVRVRSLTSNLEGHVFDAFISQYPALVKYESIEDFISGKYRWSDDEMFDFLPAMLEEYALTVFNPSHCRIQYSNGSDGEGATSLTIIQLNGNAMLIKHGYSEGHGTELEFTNIRISEIYFLILNIMKFLPAELPKINEEKIKNHVEHGQQCIGLGEHGCFIRVIFKGDNKISILFNNACC